MHTHLLSILFVAATAVWVANARADELSAAVNARFSQAANRTFNGFDPNQEQTWQRPFFFMQLADTQYGMFTGDKGFEQEVALSQRAVEHINRLRPRFAIVCGDLTNATPEHARYRAQVAQFHHDFSKVDAEIPLVCVCGNHDIGNRPTPKSIASYQENFGDDYFSFWVGGVCNIVLNSSVLHNPSGAPEVLAAQQTWLDQQLLEAKAAKAKHIFLFQHHPLFLTQEDEPDQYFIIPLERRKPLLDQLKRADVRAVFAGHYHRNAYGLAGNMEMITTGPVGRPLGKDPSGFRIVTVHETKIQHQYWGMDDVPEKIDLTKTSDAADRSPQGVAEGVEKPLLIAPRPGNGRNSEGDFIQLKDGRLLLVYSKFIGTGDHAPAELAGRYSSDRGQTWSRNDVQVVARKSGEANLMSVSLLRLPDDRIALFYVQKYDSPPGSNYPYLDYILMRTSADEGANWSEPNHVVPKDQPGYRVLNNDRVVQLKSGRLVVPVAVHYLPGWPKWLDSAHLLCYLSDDAGQSWRPSESSLQSEWLAQEPGVVQLQDGTLLMFARSRDCQLVARSKDDGETWSALERSNIAQPTASPASIERIPSTGHLLLVWNNGDDPLATASPVGRRPLTASISKDEGATWQHIQNLGTDPNGWYCYTAIEFIEDHVVLAHCEYPGLNSLQVTRLPISWLYRSNKTADGK